jgi:hypothetical protein
MWGTSCSGLGLMQVSPALSSRSFIEPFWNNHSYEQRLLRLIFGHSSADASSLHSGVQKLLPGVGLSGANSDCVSLLRNRVSST